MNEFEKQVLAMMQELKTEINGIKTEISGMKTEISGMKVEIEGLRSAQEETNRHLEQVDQRLDGLDQRMDDLTQEVRANHAAAMEGFDTMVAEIGDKQMRDGKRLNETVEVVGRLCYDVEVLKRKVG